jgi:pyruvate kinase
VALSFVRGPADVRALRDYVAGMAAAVRDRAPREENEYVAAGAAALRGDPAHLARCRALHEEHARDSDGDRDLDIPVVANLEMREAARGAAAILREAECVMVARGDLGLQCEPQEVPRLQKEILRAAARAGKPSIVATQMLGSMERFYEPRRPEASDVFNAVLDRTDAVMLSGETSTGIYPVRSVQVLREIVLAAEDFADPSLSAEGPDLARFYDGVREERAWRGDTAAITDHACYMASVTARTLGCRAIVALTHTGGTARMVARFRPTVPVYAAVHDASVARRLALSYNVRPLEVPFLPSGTPVDEAVGSVLRFLRDRGHAAAGERVVVLCGRPLGGATGTNLLSVETVPPG